MNTVEIVALRREYRSRRRSVVALDSLDLAIRPGALIALLGPNGSGKSTLIRLLVGADMPDSGTVRVFGVMAHRLGRQRARLGVVFQNASLDPLLTARENLATHAAILGAPRESVERSARLVGIADRLDDRVGTLSGGLIRRVDLARAVLHEPELIILDEPTTGLDHDARNAFLDTLERLQREHEVTVLLSTHLMDEAERADEVVLMSEGRVAATGPPDELRRSLGQHVIRAADTPDLRRTLADDVDVAEHGPDVIVSGTERSVAEAARALVAADLPFEFGPPTLGDVYLHQTGRRLAQGGAA